MKYITHYKLFESTEDNTIHIFDFDGTIVDSPKFEDLVIKLLKENVTIRDLVNKSVNLIKVSIDDLKIENGRIYVDDPDEKIKVKGNWVRKKSRVYLFSPDKFYYTDLSFPDKSLELSKLYNSVKNKAIVTARIKTVIDKVSEYLDKLGVDQPNHGLHCYPSRDESGSKVAIWKSKTVVKIIEDGGFKKAKFYDDKSKIVNAVEKLVKEKLPHVKFEGIKVNSKFDYLKESYLSDEFSEVINLFSDISDNLEKLDSEEDFFEREEEIRDVKSYWKRRKYGTKLYGGFYSIENIFSKFIRIKICLASDIKSEIQDLLYIFKQGVENMNLSYSEKWWQDRKPIRGGYFSREKNEDFSIVTIIINNAE